MDTQTKSKQATGQLFIVATPIGNLNDMTFRAVSTLQHVDKIAAEDTRTSGVLLRHFGIETPMFPCHEHNEKAVAKTMITALKAGQNIALISDAGTPLINDPGFRLVRLVREAGLRVVPIPGACSPIAALCAAGLASDHFRYLGFFPRKGSAKSEMLQCIKEDRGTLIFLESPKRIIKTLQAISEYCGERELCVARELTKLHEEILHGQCEALLLHFQDHAPRGEMVLLIGPDDAPVHVEDQEICHVAAQAEFSTLSPSGRAREVARRLHIPRSRVYQLLMHHE